MCTRKFIYKIIRQILLKHNLNIKYTIKLMFSICSTSLHKKHAKNKDICIMMFLGKYEELMGMLSDYILKEEAERRMEYYDSEKY